MWKEKVKCIFFDVGGTLCKASENNDDEYPTFKTVISRLIGKEISGFSPELKQFLWISSAPKSEIIRTICNELGFTEWEKLLNSIDNFAFKIALYPDVIPCLRMLKDDFKLGILSNTSVWTAYDHNQLGLGDYMSFSVLSCKIGFAKPSIEIFNRACETAGFNPEEMLYVGDVPELDIIPALRSGWKAILLERIKIHNDIDVLKLSDLRDLPEMLNS